MPPLDVSLQEGVRGECLFAQSTACDCLKAHISNPTSVPKLRFEHADVLSLVLELRLRSSDTALECHVATMQRLLHVEQVLGDELLEAEELQVVIL